MEYKEAAMIGDIKKNIDDEIRIIREISIYMRRIETANPSERPLLANAINSLVENFRRVNDNIPILIQDLSLGNEAKEIRMEKKSEMQSARRIDPALAVKMNPKDKKALLKELGIGPGYLKKIRKSKYGKKEEYSEFKAARGYLKFANKMFWDKAVNSIHKGYFKRLSRELQKANIDILFQSYVAMMYMTVFLSFIISIFVSVFLFFFDIHFEWPILALYEGDLLIRFLQIFWIPFAVPLIVLVALYYYPMSEKRSLAKRINQELAFAVIHMSAISGSGIQPIEIFRIIGLGKEYPYLKKEIRKILNQINLYGYDLVTALNNAAATTSSTKLSELFSGLATTITSGGDLSEFFEKRAETLLTDYRLEREKYTKTAETFMDIYISVVIAAPMILMLLLIMLTLGNFDIGLSTPQLTVVIVSVIALINVVFLVFVHINQPSY